MKKLLLLAFFGCVVVFLPIQSIYAQDLTTFILVRHAEKMDDGTKDPDLSEAGELRARRLAEHLRATDITAVYSTPYQRTRNTVNAIAEEHNISVQEYEPFDPETLTRMLQAHPGGIILISGHSNTTPNLVNALIGEERFEQLDESDYENLFIVTLTEIGSGKAVHLHY